jgi:signal transduction histidine kinase
VHTDLVSAADARCSAKLARVLDSLVDNAVRYTPTGGSVTVTATAVNGVLELNVQDSGMGLTGEQRERVFEPFWRGDRSRSTQAPASD